MFDMEALLQTFAKVAAGEIKTSRGFEALDVALAEFPGHRLFTVLVIDWERGENRRIYSSAPSVYPSGGAKPLRIDSEFYRNVVSAGQSRLCRTREECRAAFPDYDLIEQLGCESAINLPIRSNGETLGSLNLLHKAGWYTVDMLSTLERFALLSAPLLLTFVPKTLNRQHL